MNCYHNIKWGLFQKLSSAISYDKNGYFLEKIFIEIDRLDKLRLNEDDQLRWNQSMNKSFSVVSGKTYHSERDKNIQKYEENRYKAKVNQEDPRYYKIKANFKYLDNYNMEIVKEVGRGGYGVVYKALSTYDENIKEEYAVKINFNTVAKELIYSEGAFLKICKEKRNLPKLVNFFDYENSTHIVTEYFSHTPFIEMFYVLKVEDIKHYLMELLIGLKSLKEVGIYHRDIKPGNFLYNIQKKTGIIVDFGLAEIDESHETIIKNQRQNLIKQGVNVRSLEEKINIYEKLRECLKIVGNHKIGTESYMPIESILHAQKQNYESDIWPVGIILLQFVLRKYNIFNHLKPNKKIGDLKNNYFVYYFLELATFFGKEKVIKTCQKLGYLMQLPEHLPELSIKDLVALQDYTTELQDLLFRLLQLDVQKRINVDEAISHPFFNSVRKDHLQVLKKK